MPSQPLHVSLIAIPDAMASTLTGIYDALSSVERVAEWAGVDLGGPQFEVELVGLERSEVTLASGLPLQPHRSLAEVTRTDLVVVPSLLAPNGEWEPGRYPALVEWCVEAYANGAALCSACSGLLVLAETGLFDGHSCTVHFGYANEFRRRFPAVPVTPERVLLVSGEGERLITSGAATSWHDLALYLVARYVSPLVAQAVARFYAFQMHPEGLAPFVVFEGRTDHGDSAIETAQRWIADHLDVPAPVEEMAQRSGLTERTFKRRFTEATGLAPIAYVQRLRVEQAKRMLEADDAAVDDIGWRVGYEDASSFRRLFRRTVGLTPSAYRRRFRVPSFEDETGATVVR
ncbi:MAG: helix-turn-helix domain-containing protein [Dehalococcoidia bacterium]